MASPRTLSLRETTAEELVEAAERMDAGCRLIWPMLHDGLGADPEQGQTEHLPIEDAPVTKVTEVDEELLERVAAKVADFRSEAAAELKHLDKNAPRHIHVEALVIVASLDDFLLTVGEYVRSGR